jgi:hypothetical protein
MNAGGLSMTNALAGPPPTFTLTSASASTEGLDISIPATPASIKILLFIFVSF